MKLLHISDLHIGRKIKGYSLLEDQKYILNQIIDTIKERKIDGIIIAGDIYDTSTPTNEAMNCFDRFISDIHSLNVACYAVSGNHDSIYRVAFGSDIMAREKIYFSKKYKGDIAPIKADKNINIWLLPFIRPVDVRHYHPDFAIGNYNEMMKTVVSNLDIDTDKINILVAHQFVTCGAKNPETSESETVSLGTLDNVDISNFDKFDYVALGHIHKPQTMGRNSIRYSGSILKYSFSEKDDVKSMVLLDIKNKNINIESIPYKAQRDMKEFCGCFDELLKYHKCDDYLRIVLKDENYITDVKQKLEVNFKNIMEIVYDNLCSSENSLNKKTQEIENKTPLELFEDFYELQNNRKMNDKERKTVQNVFEDVLKYNRETIQ